jgi:hypothetical protein
MKTPKYIEDHEKVLAVYKDWPSFHDCEVISLTMDRIHRLPDGGPNARVELLIHAWEMTDKVNENKIFIRKNHQLVRFEFDEVFDLEMKDFNRQNVIFGLSFEEKQADETTPAGMIVRLQPSYGICGSFAAVRGRVLSVKPCDNQGRPEPAR